MKISSQLESALSFNVSTAWFVSCGDGLRHFGKEIKNRSIRPCPWSNSVTRRAANGTCVAPSMEKGVFVEISRVFSVAYLLADRELERLLLRSLRRTLVV